MDLKLLNRKDMTYVSICVLIVSNFLVFVCRVSQVVLIAPSCIDDD